jgi:hypothetical protein
VAGRFRLLRPDAITNQMQHCRTRRVIRRVWQPSKKQEGQNNENQRQETGRSKGL